MQRTNIGKSGTNGYHRITGAMGANAPFPYNDPQPQSIAGRARFGSTLPQQRA